MTEPKPGTDAPESEVSEAGVSDAEMAELANSAKDGKPDEERPDTARKHRVGPWLFLVVVFVGLPAVWFYGPPEMRQQILGGIDSMQAAKPAPTPASVPAQPAPATKSDSDKLQQAGSVPGIADEHASTEPINTPAPAAPAPATSGHIDEAPVAKHADAIRTEIERLQAELDSLHAEKDALALKANAPDTIELRAWLDLLAGPHIPLLQRVGMWGYLTSRPSLDKASQQTADDMAGMLMKDSAKLDRLRASLKDLADSIPEERSDNIIPKPGNPYFAWMAGVFQLRKASAPGTRDALTLRLRLLAMEHALTIGDWPEQQAWEALLDTAQATLSTLDETIPFDMRDELRAIRKDIQTSRRRAGEWKESL